MSETVVPNEKPISPDVARYMASLPEVSTQNPDQLALHGMDIVALVFLLKNGYLAGNTAPQGETKAGDLSIYPLPHQLKSLLHFPTVMSLEKILGI